LDTFEFLATPTWATEALLRRIRFEGMILEPCCGDGAISRVLLTHGYQVASFDIVDRGYGKQQNFFLRDQFADNIITNPPFNNAVNIVRHALWLSRRQTAMLLPTWFLNRRHAKPLFQLGLKCLLPFTKRVQFVVGRSCDFEVAWYVWERGHKGSVELSWI